MLKLLANSPIPLIRTVDVLILDGGLAGLEAARRLAQQNLHVLVVESATYLGGKLTKTQRPWVNKADLADEFIQQWFVMEQANPSPNHPELAVFAMGDLKTHFEDVLLTAKVELLYASRPVDAFREGDRWIVVIGNKSGCQAISAKVVIDNSDQATLTWISREAYQSAAIQPRESTELLFTTATISFSGIGGSYNPTYDIPEEMGVDGERVRVIQGGIQPHHGFVEFCIQNHHDRNLDPVQEARNRHFKAYETGFKVAEYLVNQVEAFHKAEIGLVSREVLDDKDYSPLQELHRGRSIAQSLSTQNLSARIIVVNPERAPEVFKDPELIGEAHFQDDNEITSRSHYPRFTPPPLSAPILTRKEVCVAGGGTSGAIAGYIAASEGIQTVVVDMNPVLGGTGTIGGVHTHWMSHDSAINEQVDNKVKALGKRFRIPERYPVDYRDNEDGMKIEWFKDYSWHKEIKAFALYEMNRDAGVEIFTHCLLIGTIVKDQQVLGTIYATPFGPRCVLSQITIDATGDGDVAAFAGAEYIYGAQRDRYTMWTSMAQYTSPDNTLNNFTSPADVGDIFDYTRFIMTSRRRKSVRAYDHVEYVAPRETRHILGEYTVTLKDQLLQKTYPDTIAVFYSNYDLRGRAFADIVLFGLMPPNLDIEIPYRALLPKHLENIIIAGKAYSITHDALSSARMQRDMQQLGASVAIAASLAIREKRSPRSVQPEAIRQKLKARGILPPLIREKRNINPSPNLQELIQNLDEKEPMEWLFMGYWERAESLSPILSICYADSEEVKPLLLEAHQKAKGDKRLLLARLLLWHKSDVGIDDIIRTVYQELDEGYPLPQRNGDIYWTTGSPEQGIMPEVLYLIYPLARVQNPKVHKLILDLVHLIGISDRNYLDRRKGSFDYIDCVAYIAERQANHVYIPLLEQLLDLPELKNTVQKEGFTPDYMPERLAYLSLSLFRALARCGSKKGLLGLITFLEDNRAYLSKSAHDELIDITRLNLPMDGLTWTRALKEWPEMFDPIPLLLEIH